MRNEFTAIFELDDSGDEPRYIAYCVEIPGAHADGKTMDEARAGLTEAIKSALQARREKPCAIWCLICRPMQLRKSLPSKKPFPCIDVAGCFGAISIAVYWLEDQQ